MIGFVANIMGLNTFFIRYGCRTARLSVPVRKLLSQYLLHQVWVSDMMAMFAEMQAMSLNTFYIRYGCRTTKHLTVGKTGGSLNTFFIRYGCRTNDEIVRTAQARSQYLLHQVWVSDLRG